MAASEGDKRAWLQRVLGIDLGGETKGVAPVGTGSGGEAGHDDPLNLVNRMASATRQLNAMKAEGDPALPALMTAHAEATTAVNAKAPNAGGAMDALEAALARAASAARGRAAATGNTGKVAYAQLLLRWHAAQKRVDDNLKALGEALLSDPEILNDPDFPEIQEAVADLPYLVPELGETLDDVLDAARDPAADTQALHREALEIIDEYRNRIGAVSALRELEPFSAGTKAGKIDLFSEFSAALNDLEAELSKAA